MLMLIRLIKFEWMKLLMASVQQRERQRWALDKKMTCFGISLNGEAAFPNVEREVQV